MKKNDGKPTVFVSYSRKDIARVREIVEALQQHNVHVLWDEGSMHVGDRLLETVFDQLREADYLLVVHSENSANSSWVQKEVRSALTKKLAGEWKIEILPALIDNSKLPDWLSEIHYADFRTSWQKGLKHLIDTVAPLRETRKRTRRPEFVENSIGMRLALIPAGTFMMGSPDKEIDSDFNSR